MLKIITENQIIEWEFNGIKILSALNSSWTLLKLEEYIKNRNVSIDENVLLTKDCLIINEYSTLASLLSLSKTSSQFLKNLVLAFDVNSIINEDKLDEFIKIINWNSENLVSFNHDPIDLIIKNFQIDKTMRINNNNFKKILDCYKQSSKKMTIIISNCFWFKFNLIKEHFSFFNFIIITNTITQIGLNSSELEDCVAIQNCKKYWYEILDLGKLLLYIEKELNSLFDTDKMDNYLDSNPYENLKIYNILRKIF